eukprot:g1046.t1
MSEGPVAQEKSVPPEQAPSSPQGDSSSADKFPKKRKSIVARLFDHGPNFARARSGSDDKTSGWKKAVGYAPAVILTREQQKEFREQEMKKFELQFQEDTKVTTKPWKLKVLAWLDSTPIEVMMMMLTVFALYGADIANAHGTKEDIVPMSITNLVVMIVFLVELGINSVCKPGYFLMGNFWLDFLAAASLIGDINFIADEIIPSGFAAARAGRAARAGTKAGRLVKLVRLTRLVRLVRIARLRKYMKRKQRVSVVDMRGTEEEREILRKARERDKRANANENTDESADGIANGIAGLTTFKVIVLILLMLLAIPMLQINPHEVDSRGHALVSLQSIAESSDDSTLIAAGVSSFKNNPDNKDLVLWMRVNGSDFVPKNNDKIDSMRSADLQPYGYGGASCGTNCYLYDEKFPALLVYDIEVFNRADATNSCWTTTFIIVLIIGAMQLFRMDANKLADRMTDPLVVLSEDMELVSNMSLGTTISHKPSSVKEIRNIQQTFLRMKYGLGSFAKYVPYEVVRGMMSRGEEAVLGVAPREITIFFSDIAGFTTICEKMKPNELLILLSDYFAAMSTLISQSDGTLLEFIGDAILAVWNAPMAVSDHAYQCVEQSIKMHSYLDKMQPEWAGKGYPPIKIRCGIHTSTVFVGNIGSPDRMKYGVLGDGVNLASRLEELNKRYSTRMMISINTRTKQKVTDHFLIRPLDVVAVKGKSKGTAIFEVMGRLKHADDFEKSIQQAHEQGFQFYQKQEWDKAIEKFDEVIKIRGGADVAAQLIKDRCISMKSNPPPAGWDGCEVLNQKHF